MNNDTFASDWIFDKICLSIKEFNEEYKNQTIRWKKRKKLLSNYLKIKKS